MTETGDVTRFEQTPETKTMVWYNLYYHQYVPFKAYFDHKMFPEGHPSPIPIGISTFYSFGYRQAHQGSPLYALLGF